jgi:predicted transcriptional regulator YdeE
MNNYIIDKDITLMYVKASSFPDGVMAAHQQLHASIPLNTERKYYGISYPDQSGDIIYKAAAEEMHAGEAAQKGLETFIVKKGAYASIIVPDYMNENSAIGEAFQKLLKHPQLDPQGFCLEWYLSKTDVQCMVPLNINQ